MINIPTESTLVLPKLLHNLAMFAFRLAPHNPQLLKIYIGDIENNTLGACPGTFQLPERRQLAPGDIPALVLRREQLRGEIATELGR